MLVRCKIDDTMLFENDIDINLESSLVTPNNTHTNTYQSALSHSKIIAKDAR